LQDAVVRAVAAGDSVGQATFGLFPGPNASKRSTINNRINQWPDLRGFAARLTATGVHAKIKGLAYDRNSYPQHALHACSTADLDKLQPSMLAAVKWHSLRVIAEIPRLAPPPL
jgi:hypothetical protein